MCEANAYLLEDGEARLVLASVDEVIPGDGEVFMRNIFGERRTIAARIRELKLVEHRIILERWPQAGCGSRPGEAKEGKQGE